VHSRNPCHVIHPPAEILGEVLQIQLQLQPGEDLLVTPTSPVMPADHVGRYAEQPRPERPAFRGDLFPVPVSDPRSQGVRRAL
jgi:hypothetical protein